jgi:hypothetical protein
MTRPQIPVNWDRVDELIESGCPGTEIAGYFGMHPETFYDRVVDKYKIGFTEFASKRKSKGDALIREAQFNKAIKKMDNTMLIWLGKQRLGQKENPSEMQISPEAMTQFVALMSQLSGLQNKKEDQVSSCKSISNE